MKVTPNTKWMVTPNTQKKGVEKKTKNLVSVAPERIDLCHLPKCPRDPPFGPQVPQERLYMMDTRTSLSLYRNMVFEPVWTNNNKKVLLMVLRFCYSSTVLK